jgi:cytochrome P450
VCGHDADVFRPERWLEMTIEEMDDAEKSMNVLFGQGRWRCFGRNLALVEVNKMLPEVSKTSMRDLPEAQNTIADWLCLLAAIEV